MFNSDVIPLMEDDQKLHLVDIWLTNLKMGPHRLEKGSRLIVSPPRVDVVIVGQDDPDRKLRFNMVIAHEYGPFVDP